MPVFLEEKHEKILTKYNEISNEIIDLIGNDFDTQITTRLKSNKDEFRIDVHDEVVTSENTPQLTYLTILINSIYRSNKTYYPQVLLEGCKFKKKKEKTVKRLYID